MSKIKEFTRAECRTVKAEVDAALAKIATKFGLDLDNGSGSFNSAEFGFRVKFRTSSAPAKTTRAPKVTTSTNSSIAKMLGLPADVIGRKFNHKTKTFTVTALAPNRPKNAVCLEDQNGRKFKCSIIQLKAMMGY
jgi:hypothetical protein